MPFFLRLALALLCLHAVVAQAAEETIPPGASPTVLGIDRQAFTINRQPTFLLGISYYAGLGASESNMRLDLADMQRHEFNWLRVWATWAGFNHDISAIDADGKPREPYLGRLRWLVTECDRRGLIVDVTLSRGNGSTGSPRLQSLAAHRHAVETLIAALKPHRNWYLDLGNERNITDARRVDFEELAELRELARQLDPQLLVTASQGGDIGRDELTKYLSTARVDFITPHRPRETSSPGQTAATTKDYLQWMGTIGRVVPVHYQEPFRRGYRPNEWNPTAEDFLLDLRQAKESRAAGWCFHNGSQRGTRDEQPRRSFDLRERRLFDQLDDVERQVIETVSRVIRSKETR